MLLNIGLNLIHQINNLIKYRNSIWMKLINYRLNITKPNRAKYIRLSLMMIKMTQSPQEASCSKMMTGNNPPKNC